MKAGRSNFIFDVFEKLIFKRDANRKGFSCGSGELWELDGWSSKDSQYSGRTQRNKINNLGIGFCTF